MSATVAVYLYKWKGCQKVRARVYEHFMSVHDDRRLEAVEPVLRFIRAPGCSVSEHSIRVARLAGEHDRIQIAIQFA